MNNNYQVVWNITSKCNQKCKFCFRKKTTDNSLEKNKEIVDKLSELKINALSISGGEALLYKDIFYLLDYIKIKLPKTKLILNTNCQNIEDNILKIIINKFDALTLPIESVDSLYNLKIGRGSEHIENVLKIIEFCNNKIEIKINTVIMKDNINQIKKIYNLIKNYNIKRWKIFRFLPIRDAKIYNNKFKISDETSTNIENIINQLNNTSNMEISYNKEKNYKTKYFIYPDGTIENSKLEPIEYFFNKDVL